MKKFLLVLAAGCIFAGCHSKLDLDNVDPSAEVNMGLTLPVGSLRLTINDLVGNVDGLYIENGILTWKFDTAKADAYHKLDLADYLSKTTEHMKIYKQVVAKFPYLDGGATVTLPDTIKFSLDFPVDLSLEGINKDKKSERLDSAHITSASFYSIINPVNLPFEWDWLDSIVLDLGPRFKHPIRNQVPIYDRNAGGSSYDFGDSIPLIVDAFTLDMMKVKLDPKTSKAAEYYDNVYDTCSFNVLFYVTIPKGSTVKIQSDSEFKYELGARFLDYTAVWGMFDPSNEMHKEEVIDMSDTWKSFNFMKKATIPFAEPKVETRIVTHVAGALRLKDSYMFAIDQDNKKTYAQFGANFDTLFFKPFGPGQYLDPWNSIIGDTTKNMIVEFNHTSEGGRIHEMFRKSPQKLGYKYDLSFDETLTQQIRITPNTDIRVTSTLTLPFIFNEGVWIEYPDTSEVSLSQISIDSIQANSSVIDTISATNVKLIMKALSTIPMTLKLSMRCVDENGNIVMDPADPSKPFYLFDKDTITINPPTRFEKVAPNRWRPEHDVYGESYLMASLSKEQLNVFPKIKQIRYTAVLDDKALKAEYLRGMECVQLLENSDVRIKIGLAGNIDAVLNFDKENK